MKKKIYFCDLFENFEKMNAIKQVVVLLVALAVLSVISFVVMKEIRGVPEYDNEKYSYIHGIAENLEVTDGKFNLEQIPNDVEYTLKSTQDGKVYLTITIDADYSRMANPEVKATYDENLNLLSIMPNYTQKDFEKVANRYMQLDSFICGMFFAIVVYGFAWFGSLVSEIHKVRYFKKHGKQEGETAA